MATVDSGSNQGTVKTELRENAVGLPGMLMQGIATIAPSFAILASFVFIVSFAGVVTPWAYLFGGALLALFFIFGILVIEYARLEGVLTHGYREIVFPCKQVLTVAPWPNVTDIR